MLPDERDEDVQGFGRQEVAEGLDDGLGQVGEVVVGLRRQVGEYLDGEWKIVLFLTLSLSLSLSLSPLSVSLSLMHWGTIGTVLLLILCYHLFYDRL